MAFKKTNKLQSEQNLSIVSYCLFVIRICYPLPLSSWLSRFIMFLPGPSSKTLSNMIIEYGTNVLNTLYPKDIATPILTMADVQKMIQHLYLHRLNFIKFDKHSVYKEPTISTMYHVTFSRLVIRESQPTVNRQYLYCTLLFLVSTTFAITVSTIK